MSTTREKFIKKCDEIVQAKPEYKLGCSNKKQCDCIGMVKYGLRENGVTLNTTGTNWTFRNQVENKRQITSASVLKMGDVVFKLRKPGEPGYDLPPKYRKGGSAYNNDLNDYCHIGAVKSVSPLRIIHMTGPTAKTDTSIGKWKYAADLKKQYISDSPESPQKPVQSEPKPDPYQEPTEPSGSADVATVWAETGKWVKLRQKPSTACGMYDEIPIGAKVTIVTRGYDWTQVNYGKRKGWYMMTKFLKTE